MATQEKCRQGVATGMFSKPGILTRRIFLQFAIGSLALAVVCMVWVLGGRANAEVDDSASAAVSSFSILYSFGGDDGASPYGSLTLSGTTLYGMTYRGGAYGDDAGTIFGFDRKRGTFEVVHSFASGDANNGAFPLDPLILLGKTLFGITHKGGAYDAGTIFKFETKSGTFKVLHSFASGDANNGASPCGDIILSGKTLYGMTYGGGANNQGTIFKFDAKRGIF